MFRNGSGERTHERPKTDAGPPVIYALARAPADPSAWAGFGSVAATNDSRSSSLLRLRVYTPTPILRRRRIIPLALRTDTHYPFLRLYLPENTRSTRFNSRSRGVEQRAVRFDACRRPPSTLCLTSGMPTLHQSYATQITQTLLLLYNLSLPYCLKIIPLHKASRPRQLKAIATLDIFE